MNITVTGRHIQVTENLKKYATDKLKKFEKYLGATFEAIVTLDVEKYRHKADVLIRADSKKIQAESVTNEMYTSIDEVTDKLERQVKKLKGKYASQRKKETFEEEGATEQPSAEIAEVLEETPIIVKEKPIYVKPMSPEEAAMQLDLMNITFLVFTNASTSEINVIYKRGDGNYGVIEALK
jgi:putative sigma-54 modulation protein